MIKTQHLLMKKKKKKKKKQKFKIKNKNKIKNVHVKPEISIPYCGLAPLPCDVTAQNFRDTEKT